MILKKKTFKKETIKKMHKIKQKTKQKVRLFLY